MPVQHHPTTPPTQTNHPKSSKPATIATTSSKSAKKNKFNFNYSTPQKNPQKSSSPTPTVPSPVGHLLLQPHAARAQLPFRGLCRGERREAFLVEDPLGLESEVRVYPLWVIILW
jgi:hypothetical protein